MVASDQAINPELQRMFAERRGATTREVNTSHVPFVTNPAAVAGIIEEAAQASLKGAAAGQN